MRNCLDKLKNFNFCESLENFWYKLFSLNPIEKKEPDPVKRLKNSIRVTSKCRFNAAVRLEHQSRFSFFVTTIISLGLILIPLLQFSGISLAFNSSVLSSMQIFLAVSVLVFSVIIGTARYDVCSAMLTECGNKLKRLIRSIDKYMEGDDNKFPTNKLEEFQDEYSKIVEKTENHIRSDYYFAMLEMRKDYNYTGIPRVKLFITAWMQRFFTYTIPCFLLVFEIIFISDMLKITSITTPFFNSLPK